MLSLLFPLDTVTMPEGENAEAAVVTHATYNVQPPESFNFNQPQEWAKWSRRFERFRVASGLSLKDQKQQVNTFIYCLGDEADDLITAFKLTEDELVDYDTVKRRFDEHFQVKRNVIYDRANFFRRFQRENESVDVFINDLYKLVELCNFGALKDEMIRDRIVVGVRDGKLSETLQLDSNLTLEKAIERSRQSEAVKAQQEVVRKTEMSVEAVKKKSAKTMKPKNEKKRRR